MTMWPAFIDHWPRLLLWGLVATVAMTTILEGSRGLGLSRLSLPFLVGTVFTEDRNRAVVVGFIAYVLGGWMFATLYFLFFASINVATWWLGALLGFLHGVFLLVCALPLLPHAHPRMASEYDGPRRTYFIEPPGFMGLNYGVRTPLTTLLGQTIYGATLGLFCQLAGLFNGAAS
jgi:hypothetical protein